MLRAGSSLCLKNAYNLDDARFYRQMLASMKHFSELAFPDPADGFSAVNFILREAPAREEPDDDEDDEDDEETEDHSNSDGYSE